LDLRERVVAAVEAGESRRSAARRYGVSESVAIKWLQRVKATGSVKPAQMGGYRRPALEGERDWILARLAEVGSDVTVRGLAAEQDRPDVARKRTR
jgi:putative transposase